MIDTEIRSSQARVTEVPTFGLPVRFVSRVFIAAVHASIERFVRGAIKRSYVENSVAPLSVCWTLPILFALVIILGLPFRGEKWFSWKLARFEKKEKETK